VLIVDVPFESSALEPSLALLALRFLVPLSREGDASPFSNGPSSISDDEPFGVDVTRGGGGRSDAGIGRL
jgi:hypothetical protein